MTGKKYYTTQEIADILKLGLRTIQNYINDGKLKAYKIGKGWRVEEDDLQEFIKSRSNKEEGSRSE